MHILIKIKFLPFFNPLKKLTVCFLAFLCYKKINLKYLINYYNYKYKYNSIQYTLS